MKTLLVSLLLIFALSYSAWAQTKPETKAADKPVAAKPAPPAEVKFTKEQTEEAARLADKAKVAALEAENLALKIERAQLDLQKVREAASSAQTAYVDKLRAIAEQLGITKDELPNYEYDDRGPTPVLRRKADAKEKGGN